MVWSLSELITDCQEVGAAMLLIYPSVVLSRRSIMPQKTVEGTVKRKLPNQKRKAN